MKIYHQLLKDFEESFYLHATLGIILSSCLGAAAAMAVLMHGHDMAEMLQLFIITCVSMGFNTTVLANLKSKVVFNSLLLSIILNSVFIILHII